MGGVVFAFRLANVVTFWRAPAASIGAVTQANAQTATPSPEQPPPLPAGQEQTTAAPAPSAPASETGGVAGGLAPQNTDADTSVPPPPDQSDNQPQSFSTSELEVLQSLSKRRDELDAREKAIAQKEALLQAAEQEVDHKIAELNKLKGEIEDLLGKQQTMENDRIESLVKIYENMKPKEAATIFNTLDMTVLLNVISHMNERKVAPIIAAMDPQKARIVTIRLAEQHQLPSAPPAAQP